MFDSPAATEHLSVYAAPLNAMKFILLLVQYAHTGFATITI